MPGLHTGRCRRHQYWMGVPLKMCRTIHRMKNQMLSQSQKVFHGPCRRWFRALLMRVRRTEPAWRSFDIQYSMTYRNCLQRKIAALMIRPGIACTWSALLMVCMRAIILSLSRACWRLPPVCLSFLLMRKKHFHWLTGWWRSYPPYRHIMPWILPG